jgi:hypothetical protein
MNCLDSKDGTRKDFIPCQFFAGSGGKRVQTFKGSEVAEYGAPFVIWMDKFNLKKVRVEGASPL